MTFLSDEHVNSYFFSALPSWLARILEQLKSIRLFYPFEETLCFLCSFPWTSLYSVLICLSKLLSSGSQYFTNSIICLLQLLLSIFVPHFAMLRGNDSYSSTEPTRKCYSHLVQMFIKAPSFSRGISWIHEVFSPFPPSMDVRKILFHSSQIHINARTYAWFT